MKRRRQQQVHMNSRPLQPLVRMMRAERHSRRWLPLHWMRDLSAWCAWSLVFDSTFRSTCRQVAVSSSFVDPNSCLPCSLPSVLVLDSVHWREGHILLEQ